MADNSLLLDENSVIRPELFDRCPIQPLPESIGIGLTLVKQICDRCEMPLIYQYKQANQDHSFRIGFVSALANNFKFAS